MQPILIILFATAAGVPLGLWLRHNLATLSYRTEDEHDLPDPGPRWWVVWASAFALGSLATVAVLNHNPLVYLPLVPLAVAGPWLAAIDFDVLRIPNRVLAPTAVASMLVVVGITVATQAWMTLVVPTVATLATGGAFAAVHFASKAGIGFGDVKVAAIIGLALGSLGLEVVWLSIMVGSLGALVWVKARCRDGPIPYGPWLLCGAWFSELALVSWQ